MCYGPAPAAPARAGVVIEGVTPYRISHPGPGGLIFGYAAVDEQAIAEGVGILARVIGQLQHAPGSLGSDGDIADPGQSG